MRTALLLLCTITLIGCAETRPYAWQNKTENGRHDPAEDLQACRQFAAAQYRPGVPMGDFYLFEQDAEIVSMAETDYGEWRPDRSPFPVINRNELPTHQVDKQFTGYPGELDYSPDYLDAIMEKCMLDKGWVYAAEKKD